MMKLKWFFVAIFLSVAWMSDAQEVQQDSTFGVYEINGMKFNDILFLNNGSIFRGRIINYDRGNSLLFELSSGDQLNFMDSEIKRIVQQRADKEINYYDLMPDVEGSRGRPVKEKVYAFKEKGFYNATYFALILGGDNSSSKVGLGASNVSGFQFNRWIGAGFGLGYDNYSFESSETIIPVFMELRGYFTERIKSPYYVVKAGYGFALKDEDDNITEANGGFMIHPAVGVRLSADEDLNILLDIGYKFQKASFKTEFPWGPEFFEKDITFKRLTIRLGLIF